jgi:hypothetical protein
MAQEQKNQQKPSAGGEPKKIIVDEDWKHQAQKEKEILTAKEQEQEKAQGKNAARGPLPEGNFAALLSMLTTQALFAMGLLQIKGQEKREPDLELAKYNIDILETLEEKTKGNLSKDEQKVLSQTLNELRMGYVQLAEG